MTFDDVFPKENNLPFGFKFTDQKERSVHTGMGGGWGKG